MSKSLETTTQVEAVNSTPDIKIFGNTDAWLLLTKASSKSQGWMKSTKAYEIPDVGCIVQVTTEFRDKDNLIKCSEAVTFVPNCRIDTIMKNDIVIERKLVSVLN